MSTTSVEEPVAPSGTADRTARAIGYILSPLTLPPILVGFAMLYFKAPSWDVLTVTAVVFGLMTAGPAIVLIWMVRTGQASTVQVTDRGARGKLLAFALAGGIGALLVVLTLDLVVARLIAVLIAAYLFNVLLLIGINRFWKISLHAAAIAGFGAAVVFIVGVRWTDAHVQLPLVIVVAVSILLAAMVGWARLQQRLHSVPQVAAGWLVGALATTTELLIAYRLGIIP
ncbi:MAG: hypothetical protein KJO98_08340 [Rhodothermia bacterium]|nr:hypothetical protein [Rhodothermia bacterium]